MGQEREALEEHRPRAVVRLPVMPTTAKMMTAVDHTADGVQPRHFASQPLLQPKGHDAQRSSLSMHWLKGRVIEKQMASIHSLNPQQKHVLDSSSSDRSSTQQIVGSKLQKGSDEISLSQSLQDIEGRSPAKENHKVQESLSSWLLEERSWI